MSRILCKTTRSLCIVSCVNRKVYFACLLVEIHVVNGVLSNVVLSCIVIIIMVISFITFK